MDLTDNYDELFDVPPPLTKVVNMTEEHYDIRIDRKTKWGNPFHIGVDGTRDEVIQKYKDYIETQDHLIAALGELRGKKLGCWCKPRTCHGDILAKMANEYYESNNKKKI